MTRGTTPLCRFTLPFLVSDLSRWRLSFGQRGMEKFAVDDSEGTAEGRVLSVRLRQEDTLKLEAGVDVQIQLRGIQGADGAAIASRIMTEPVEPIVGEGVLE